VSFGARTLVGGGVLAPILCAYLGSRLARETAPAGAHPGASDRGEAKLEAASEIEAPDASARATASAPSPEILPKETNPAANAVQETWHVRGRVLDVRGAPVANVKVGARENARVRATSDPAGNFEVDVPASSANLSAIDDAWATVRYCVIHASNRDLDHFVVVAPPVALAGKVVDGSDRGLEGATVRIEVPGATFAAFPYPLDATGIEGGSARTNADGTFAIERAPFAPHVSLVTTFGSLRPDGRPVPDHSVDDLYIQLKEAAPVAAALEGIVVHEDGQPAPGSRVHLEGVDAAADAEGRFRLPLRHVDAKTPLVATLAGFQPAIVPDYDAVLEATDLHPPSIRLVLGPPPLSISGRVLGSDGAPQAKWRVSLLDPMVLTPYRAPAATAEKLTSNAEATSVTGDDGRFRLEGLRSAAYRLQAWNHEGAMIRTDPIQAGAQDVVIRVPDDAFVERVTGRVSGRDGTPIAGADVQILLVTEDSGYASLSQGVKWTSTRPDGTFELLHVPRRFGKLTAGGEGLDVTWVELDTVDLAKPIEVVVARMCTFRFEDDGGADPAQEFSLVDAEGKELDLVLHEAGQMSSMTTASVVDGRSQVFWVREDASRLMLRQGDRVVASQPVRLVPGDVNVVRRAR
jgi:protocatechuate 3,4-dioxygenase beta subunit